MKTYTQVVGGNIIKYGIHKPRSPKISFPANATDEQYASGGFYLEVRQPDPSYNKDTQELGADAYVKVNDEVHVTRSVMAIDNVPKRISEEKNAARNRIMGAHESFYARVVDSPSKESEYREVSRAIDNWDAAGGDVNNYPDVVVKEAARFEVTPAEAMAAIKAERTRLRGLVFQSREIRKDGIKNINKAKTLSEIKLAQDSYISQLDAIG